MHSFIFVKLGETLGLVPTSGHPLLSMALPDGRTVWCDELHKGYPIQIYGDEFLAILYKFELTDFGMILGMDYLSKYQA